MTIPLSQIPITGIILAGGKSSRIGKDKGLLKLGGRKLIEIAIANMSLICSKILISSNSDVYNQFEYKVVNDIIPDTGPMGGIYSSMKQSNTELNLVLSVDLPFVNEGLLRYIAEKATGVGVAVPWFEDEHYEPLCACYNRSILPEMEKTILKNIYKLPDLYKTLSINPLIINDRLPFYHPNLFFNINTNFDLISAKNMMKSRK